MSTNTGSLHQSDNLLVGIPPKNSCYNSVHQTAYNHITYDTYESALYIKYIYIYIYTYGIIYSLTSGEIKNSSRRNFKKPVIFLLLLVCLHF